MACPNENSVEWKIMVRNHGRIEARRIWDDLNKNIEEGFSENFPEITSEERKSLWLETLHQKQRILPTYLARVNYCRRLMVSMSGWIAKVGYRRKRN